MHQLVMFSYGSFIQSYHRRITSALVALLVLSACTDRAVGVSPGIAGTYLLQTAAGQPAPAVIHSDIDITTGQLLEIRVVGDTLDLFSNGHYIQRARIEAYIGGQLASRSRWADNGVYTVTGNAVHFDSDYLQNVAFDGSIGSIEPEKSITVTQNLAGEGTPDEYVFKNAQ
jgi:hypothetical protein